MSDANPRLFSPFQMGALTLPHRIVMAPMTRNRAGEGDVPTGLTATYYTQRASAALIVTEGSQISPQGVGYPKTPGIHTDAQVAGWRKVTGAVHAAGGRIFLQLWHCGRISHPSYHGGELPVAPSAVRPQGEAFTLEGPKPFVEPRALTVEEIPGVVRQFGDAARRAREAGFDGVEIHGANGYLIDQFLRDGTNRRTDAYGGSVENRVRFLVEVTEAVCEASSGGGRVGVRLSPVNPFNDMHDSDPVATFGRAAEALNPFGLAYLHVVEPREAPEEGERATPEIRRVFRGPLMVNQGYDRASAEAVVAAGEADLVSFGQLFLANPDLPERLRSGGPYNEPNPSTFYGGGAEGYTDYPALGEG